MAGSALSPALLLLYDYRVRDMTRSCSFEEDMSLFHGRRSRPTAVFALFAVVVGSSEKITACGPTPARLHTPRVEELLYAA